MVVGRARPLPPHRARRCSSTASTRSSPSTTSRRRAGSRTRRLDEPDDRRRVRPLLRRARASTLGDLSAAACTINEPNIVAVMGYLARDVPARAHRPRRAPPRVERRLHAPRTARGRRHQGAAPGVPVGLDVVDDRLPGRRGRRGELEQTRHMHGGRLPRCDRGDDFLGVQTLLADARRSRAAGSGRRGGRADRCSMGYEFWPEALEATDAPGVASSPAAPPDPRHRERHRHRRRRAAHRVRGAPRSRACSRASPTASTCAATCTGACSTTSSGPSATAPASGS